MRRSTLSKKNDKSLYIHPLVKRSYWGRIIFAYITIAPAIAAFYYRKVDSLIYIIFILQAITWPHIAYYIARKSRNQKKTEIIFNYNFDLLIYGVWLPIIHFNPLLVLYIFVIAGSGGLATGGFQLCISRILSACISAIIGGGIFGFHYDGESTFLMIITASIAILFVTYSASILTYRSTKQISLTKKKLQNAQKQISKYIDPKVAEKIFEGEITAELTHRRAKLTMFFSDIKNFTHFTDTFDPEDVAILLNEYFGEMAGIVRNRGGTISQFSGDSIYVIFGAPDSKGERDDALSCVRMAMEMQERMKTLREKWWNDGIQLPFEIRCGIHTGMANVGNYGSEGFMEYSAIGLNTNLASRLEQVCKPGEIYLSHSTWSLVKDEIPCEEVGTIEVKGFHYPIQTHRVLLSDKSAVSTDEVQIT